VPFWRRKHDPEPIDETEAYERAYGGRRDEVKRIQLPPRRPRDADVLKTGERMRKAFLDRLEQRDPDREEPTP
jgi:hypothetical protein